MKMDHVITMIAASILAGTLLSGCGSDDPGPTPEIAIGTSSDSPFTAEQQEVVEAGKAFYGAIYSRGTKDVEQAIEGRVTDELAAQLAPDERAFVEGAGLKYFGSPQLKPDTVKVDGDTATLTGCLDGADAFLIRQDDDAPGIGSKTIGSLELTIKLVRQDDRWLVDNPIGEQVDSC